MSAPYDPRAAALDALASQRWPDVSDPPVEQADAIERYFAAVYQLGVVGLIPPRAASVEAYMAGFDARCAVIEGRPLVPPA